MHVIPTANLKDVWFLKLTSVIGELSGAMIFLAQRFPTIITWHHTAGLDTRLCSTLNAWNNILITIVITTNIVPHRSTLNWLLSHCSVQRHVNWLRTADLSHYDVCIDLIYKTKQIIYLQQICVIYCWMMLLGMMLNICIGGNYPQYFTSFWTVLFVLKASAL